MLAYVVGAIPFSYIIAKVKGINLLQEGSKSSGATNVYRLLGIRFALLAFSLDLLKGYIVVWLTYQLTYDPLMVTICGLMAILGHTLTPFLKFKGGKGVATGLGVMFFFQPLIAVVGFITALVLFKTTRYVSVGSIVASTTVLILSYLPIFSLPPSYKVVITVAVSYIIYKHIPNIKRLLQGKENKI